MKRAYLLLSVMLVLCFINTVFASWMLIPLEKLVKDNPLIIKGKITSIKRAAFSKNPREFKFDTAYITINKILKNTLKNKQIKIGDQIPLSMPSINNKMVHSTTIRYKKGQEGIWILEFRKNSFWATYPMDFQPNSNEKKITEIILKTNDQGGTPVKGLKFTLKADKTHLKMTPKTLLRAGLNTPRYDAEQAKLTLSFTNVSDKPIRLNMYDLTWRHIAFDVKGPDDKSVRIYGVEVERRMIAAGKRHFPLIQPGTTYEYPYSRAFPGRIGCKHYHLLKPGEYTVKITYSPKITSWIQDEGIKELQNECWKGKVTSNKITLNYTLKKNNRQKAAEKNNIKDIF